MVCRTKHDLSTLLTGFAQPTTPLQADLERIHAEVANVKSGVNDLQAHAAENAASMRRVLGAVSSEVTDCPRLFTITPEDLTGARRLRFYQRHYRLVLWCEHSDQWHPWLPASYSLDQPKDWLVRVGPYAKLVIQALQLAVPIAASVAGVVLTAEQLKQAQHELDLMKTLVAALPHQTVEDQRDLIARGSVNQLTPAQGQAARAVRTLLLEHDHMQAFGDLRRVQSPSGDFLWVCTNHYSEYDPGLPHMP